MPSPRLSALPATFSYATALERGLTRYALYRMRDAGEIELLSRGLFRRAGAPLADFDLLEIALRAPRATLCLATALARHELSDAIPAAIDIALPRGTRSPRTRSPTRVHFFEHDTFDLGRESIALDAETSLGLYGAERCIIDAFRMRGVVGHAVANEALRRWLRRPGSKPSDLLRLAAKFARAQTPLRHALEVLL